MGRTLASRGARNRNPLTGKADDEIERCIAGMCIGGHCPCLCHTSLRLTHAELAFVWRKATTRRRIERRAARRSK